MHGRGYFKVESLGSNTIALKNVHNGKYCTDWGGGVSCNFDQINGWERFIVTGSGKTEFALKGGKEGKYCTPEPLLKCTSASVTEQQKIVAITFVGKAEQQWKIPWPMRSFFRRSLNQR